MASARTEIPYRSQYASAELAGEIVAGRLALIDDPRWREAGAIDREEYVRWAVSAERHWGTVKLAVFPDDDTYFKMVSHPSR